MAEKTNKRKYDIIFLNILFCFLVIFIHISSEVVVNGVRGSIFHSVVVAAQRLSSFVVQGFLLLSGAKLFLNKSEKLNYFSYYFSRFLRIIVPYVIWVIIYYIYFVYNGYFEFSLEDLGRYILNGELSAHFYFVIILVQFTILTPLWRFLYNRGNAAVHIAFSLMVTVISSQYLMPILTTLFPSIPNIDFSTCFLRYQIYWTAGCLIGKHYTEFQNYLKKNFVLIIIGFLFVATLNAALTLTTVGSAPSWLEFIHMLYCMCAILFFYMIAQLFTGRASIVLKPLAPVDRSSYTIYLIHCLVLVAVNDYMTNIGITSLSTRFGIRAAAVYGISIGICLIWQLIKFPFARLIKRTKTDSIV